VEGYLPILAKPHQRMEGLVLRVSNTNDVYWGERKIDQCIRLSIADMERNESMLIAASYF